MIDKINRKALAIGGVYLITLLFILQPAHAQEKITGPWLWMITPTESGKGGADSIDIDSLAIASRGAVSESDIAKNGANEGERLGNFKWTLGEIAPTGHNNINECLNQIGLVSNKDLNDYSSYALIALASNRPQHQVAMRVGSDDAIKVWLNGEVVHTNAVNRGAINFQEEFPVDLRVGENLLMVKVSEANTSWSMFVGINADVTVGGKQFRSESHENMVRLVYFRPSDRAPRQNVDRTLDSMIKESQQFFAQQMTRHGFEGKTFQFEMDRNGNAVVHHITGKFTDVNYQLDTLNKVWSEVDEHFSSGDAGIYITAADVGGNPPCGVSSNFGLSGKVFVPAYGFCLNVRTITHELGHTFGLAHDFRSDTYRMSYGGDSSELSYCAAEWLDAHRYFNTYPLRANTPTEMELLPSTSVPVDPTRIRFKITDPDGLHQAHLLTPSPRDPNDLQLIACKRLEGTSHTIEFITTDLAIKPGTDIALWVIDAQGVVTKQLYRNYLDTITVATKITGPWLWMVAPTEWDFGGADSIDIDSLAIASADVVSEADIARNGANEGDKIGDFTWTLGEIAPTGKNNVYECLYQIGLINDSYIDSIIRSTGYIGINHHSSYALTTLASDKAQHQVTMKVGSDDAIKVWLNGEVVHINAINRGATDYQDTFTVDLKKGDNLLLVKVSNWFADWSMFVGIDAEIRTVYKQPPRRVDINADGVVNIQDLVLVAANFGKTGQNIADVDGNGIVDIRDLVIVAGSLGTGAAAPSLDPRALTMFTAADVQQWLSQTQHLNSTDATLQRGVHFLEQLLEALIPKETALLHNYPNPFNPETWIPYQLAKPTDVTLTIYAANGNVIRRLVLGHQPAGVYQSKSRAAYWDGRNNLGERVASGVYFYQLQTDEISPIRKMVILK